MTVRPPVASERIVCTSFRAVVESNPDVGCTSTKEGANATGEAFADMCAHCVVWARDDKKD